MVQCDISRELLSRSQRPQDSEIELKNYLLDEDDTLEGFPFEDNSLDLVVSSLGESCLWLSVRLGTLQPTVLL